MSKIKDIKGYEILDSKGSPTVEAEVILDDGVSVKVSCPSGTSVGSYEAHELRDQDPKRFQGQGVLKAIENIEKIIAPALKGSSVLNQQEIDRKLIELDGTENKSKLGGNAILSVSMAVAKAGAKKTNVPLFLYIRQMIKKDGHPARIPIPCFNLINGGKHADNNLDFQEFLLIPASSKSYSDCLQIGTTIYSFLENKLKTLNLSTLVGLEGGFGPNFSGNNDALDILRQTINSSSFKFGFDVFLGLDVAATSFFREESYHMKDNHMSLSSSDLIYYLKGFITEYNLLYLEDPLFEDDWDSWTKITQEQPQVVVIGDDLIATNPYRLQIAINKKAITGVVIKPNQIGTVTEALAVLEIARASNLKIIVSHRSAETNDDFIADFAVGVGSDYVKFGAPARGERVAKYNRLLEIERIIKTS